MKARCTHKLREFFNLLRHTLPSNIVPQMGSTITQELLIARQRQQPHPLLQQRIRQSNIVHRQRPTIIRHPSYAPRPQPLPQQQPQPRRLLLAPIPPANIAIRLRPTITQQALCALLSPILRLQHLDTRPLNIAHRQSPHTIHTASSARLQPPHQRRTPTAPVSTAHLPHSTTTRMLTAAQHRQHTLLASIASRRVPTTIRRASSAR